MGDTLLYLLGGLWLTVALMLGALAIGLVLGLALAGARMSGHAPLRLLATAYIMFLRGGPLLVTILILCFGLPGIIGRYVDIPLLGLATAALGLCYSAYLAEVFRAGIESVDEGQREAARALGLSGRQTLQHVILPQATRNVLPALVNQAVALLKDTSLVSFIGAQELTQRARLEVAATYKTFEVYGMLACVYFALTISLSQLARALERRQDRARADHTSTRAA